MHRMGHGPMRTLFNLWSCGSWESWDSIRIVEKHATVNYSAPRMVKKMKRSAVSTQHASWWLQPRNMMHRQFNSSVIYSKDADGSAGTLDSGRSVFTIHLLFRCSPPPDPISSAALSVTCVLRP